MRVVAVADSDSYLKWAAGHLAALDGHDTRLVLVRSPLTPSPRQRAAALAGTRFADPPVVSARRLARQLRVSPPDVVMLACTGPVVQLLARSLSGTARRPVLATGLPGISVPATSRAWEHRMGTDLFLVHSRREREEFTALGATLGATGQVVLARLPFLSPRAHASEAADELVFAAQAKVPPHRFDRFMVLLSLNTLAERRPDLRVVVKVRAVDGEPQTHAEAHPYPALWEELAGAGTVRRDAVTFSAAPMAEHLSRAWSLATVSSTAALEALAAGVPVLVLGDWGVDAAMLNLTFEGSGLVGDLIDLAAGRTFVPDAAWAERNGLHAPGQCDWEKALQRAVVLRAEEGLPHRPSAPRRPGPLVRVRLALPTALVPVAVRAARTASLVRRRRGAVTRG